MEINISNISIIISFILLFIPLILDYYYKFNLSKSIIKSFFQMILQLVLIGIFLKFLFNLNNIFINILWVIFMIIVSVFSIIKTSNLKISKFIMPVSLIFIISNFIIVLYFNYFVLKINNIFEAKYLIILSGMILGNTMRGNIIGLTNFYSSIKKTNKKFLYILSLGANLNEAISPYLKESMILSIKPLVSLMATMGIVSLPGMMTGVILGGTSVMLAVKYQIIIIIGILVSMFVCVLFSILLTLKVSFTKDNILKEDIFV